MAAVKKKAKSASSRPKKKVAKKAAKKKATKKKVVKKAAKKATKKKVVKKAAKKATKKKVAKKKATKKVAKKTTQKAANDAVTKTAAKKVTKKKKAANRPKPVNLPSRVVAPAAKPLTKAKIASFRETLLAKQKEIQDLYSHDIREGLRTRDDGAEDVVDRANKAYNRELNFALSDGERELLVLIEEALLRLDDGTFGVCLNCGTQIAEERLQAVPWAKYCIDCQELLERGLLAE